MTEETAIIEEAIEASGLVGNLSVDDMEVIVNDLLPRLKERMRDEMMDPRIMLAVSGVALGNSDSPHFLDEFEWEALVSEVFDSIDAD